MMLSKQAFDLALVRHAGQMYGARPYVAHLNDVVQVLTDFGVTTEDWYARAYLHDILEDTETSYLELRRLFGEHIANDVFAVSGFGRNRQERNADIKRKLELHGFNAQVLKIADRIANCESGAKNERYRAEYPEFIQSVHRVPEKMKERLRKALQIEQVEVK